MTKNLFLFFFLLPAIAWGKQTIQPPPEGSIPLRVVTFNMKIGLMGLEKVAFELKNLKPDIVLLQEVLGPQFISGFIDQANYLAEDLDMEYRFGHAHTWLSGQYGIAILSRYPIIADHTFALPNLPGEEPEALLLAKVSTPRGPLAVYNTHLIFKARHDDHRAGPLRMVQAKFILNILEKESDPLLFGGDLNAFGLSPVRRLFRKHLRDTFEEVGQGWGGTFGAKWAFYKIDYLFFRGPLFPQESRTLNLRVSDHRALFSVLYL